MFCGAGARDSVLWEGQNLVWCGAGFCTFFFDGRRKSERVVKSEAVLCGKRSIQFTTAWASESCWFPDLLRTWCVSDSSGRVPVLICTGDPLTLMDPCAEIFDRYSALESPPWLVFFPASERFRTGLFRNPVVSSFCLLPFFYLPVIRYLVKGGVLHHKSVTYSVLASNSGTWEFIVWQPPKWPRDSTHAANIG